MRDIINTKNFESYLFYFLILLHIAYVFSLPVFLTQDGPSHLYNSKIFLDYIFNENNQLFNQFFELNNNIIPNYLHSLILCILLFFFNPFIAEKIIIALLIISMPLAFRFIMKKHNSSATFLSYPIFIFSNSYFLFYGFFNFQLSITILILFIGKLIDYRDNLDYKNSFKLFFILTLLFFTHPVGYIIAVVVLLLEILLIIYNNNSVPLEIEKITSYLLVIFPTLLLFIQFFVSANKSGSELINISISKNALLRLIDMNHLIVFSQNEEIIYFLLFMVVLLNLLNTIFGKIVKKRNGFNKVMLMAIVFNIFVYFFINDKLAGGAYLNNRISIYIYIFTLLFIGLRVRRFTYKQLTILVSTLIIIYSVIIRYPIQKKISTITEDYLQTIELIPNNSILLPLSLNNYGLWDSRLLSPNLAIFKHISGYLGATKSIISMDNYEANTGHFPIAWKDDVNPYNFLSTNKGAGIESNHPSVDIEGYNNRIDNKIDYVLIWGDKESSHYNERISAQLINYKLINESLQKGLWQLYIHNQ